MKKLICILLLFLLSSCSSRQAFKPDTAQINVWQDVSEKLDFDIHSAAYLLADLSNFRILYSDHADEPLYPASLTKVLTLDTVLNLTDDLQDTSRVSYQQVEDLIREDASLAYIQRDYDYTLEDLLYALILPSGADAALALENYFTERGLDLVEEMNDQAAKLGCSNSHFINSTGLHEDDHYMSLNDLFLIVMDALRFEDGRKILESIYHMTEDGIVLASSLRAVSFSDPVVLGGKTGYTPEAGQNIMILYRQNGRSYLLILANAYGSYANNEYWHFEDAIKIFDELYGYGL